MVPEIWSTTEIIFVILDHFLPFTHVTTQKIKIFENIQKKKKKKNSLEILHISAINENHMMYGF